MRFLSETHHRKVFWTLAGVVSAILLGIGVALVRTPAVRYRLPGDADSLHAALERQVEPGASLDDVVRLLGPGESPANPQKLRAAIQRTISLQPQGFPEGVTDRDTFRRYRFQGGSTYLQFRDGRLVNHDPSAVAVAADAKVLGRR